MSTHEINDLKRRLYAALLSQRNEALSNNDIEVMALLSADPYIQSLLADKR